MKQHLFTVLAQRSGSGITELTFPDIPGLVATSATAMGVVPAAQAALSRHFEKHPFVRPTPYMILRKHPSIMAARAARLSTVRVVVVPYVCERKRQMVVRLLEILLVCVLLAGAAFYIAMVTSQ